jgi:hypothetical protein
VKKAMSILIFLLVPILFVQGQEAKYYVLRAKIINGDTIPEVLLKELEVYALRLPKTRKDQRKLTKLIRNIKAVYPYAKLAGIKLNEYEEVLMNAPDDKARKKLMKQAEKEINEEYGGELRDLTFTQGKILIKLIDRETGESSYELLQDLRGKFTAFWYQAFARIWGYNLKVEYDPEHDKEDQKIEIIVRMIERGQI